MDRNTMRNTMGSLALSAAVALGLALGLGGCVGQQEVQVPTSSSSSSSSSSSDAVVEEPVDERPVLGTEGSVEVAVTNELGQDVTKVEIKLSSDADWPAEVLDLGGATFEQGVESRLLFTPNPDSADDAAYDVRLTGADGTTYEFDELQLVSYASATFRQGDDVNYVDYTLADGTAGSTHDAAVQRKADADAAAAAEAQAQAEAEAQAQAQQQQQTQTVQYQQQPVQQQSAPQQQTTTPAAPQQEDNCATDVILN